MVALAMPRAGAKLGRRKLAAGAVSGVLVLLLAVHRAENPLHFLLLAGFGGVLAWLALCDAATMLLPNRVMFPALAAALLLAGCWPEHSLVAAIVGGLAAGGIMFVCFVVLPGFGAGDVKLCALIGLLIGWPHVLAALFIGIMVNGLIALAGLIGRRLTTRQAMPYGPGLIVGALLVLMLGHA